MIVALVDWVTAQLEDPTSGLVKTLPDCPLTNPTITLPASVRIVHGFRHGWAARGDLPRSELEAGPLVVVRLAGETELAFMAEHEQQAAGPLEVNCALHYAALGSHTDQEYLIAEAVLRTAQRVLTQRFATGEDEPEFVHHGVFIQRPRRVTYLPPFDEGSDAVISVACIVPFPVHDAWALGNPVP